ncbi:hypothetical protein ACFE04_008402 [Oxalis oulophora]
MGSQEKIEKLQRAQWLRAAILGANDGLLSTTSLMIGVAAAKQDRQSILLSGFAGAIAGACSMAVGEFVSVSTQRDIEKSTNNIIIPNTNVHHETKLEISDISNTPGRSPFMKVLAEDTKRSVVEAQVEEEEEVLPNPYKASAASALSFLCGSMPPLASALFITQNVIRIVVIAVVASITLAFFGGFGAYLGGSPVKVSGMRVLLGGWIAMAITYGLLIPFEQVGDSD